MKKKFKESVNKPMPENVTVDVGRRIVLVGTYKGDQLTKWRGWYNYPISDDDKITEADAASITELWLFNGTKAQRTYKAEFVGIKTRKELVGEYGYPAKGSRTVTSIFSSRPSSSICTNSTTRLTVSVSLFARQTSQPRQRCAGNSRHILNRRIAKTLTLQNACRQLSRNCALNNCACARRRIR
ncbi:MAG: hypothetical protein J6P13_04500 [Kiritimatiellae bacterium]|nr:hypothetical protein [Kiritimatiellia bacterium]